MSAIVRSRRSHGFRQRRVGSRGIYKFAVCMLFLPHTAIDMFHPSSDLVHMLNCDPLKQNTGHLYFCQPHTIQIIQLVEATPPPRCISSSSSPASSSVSSYPSTSDSEEDCSSYCSSIITPDDSSHSREPIPWTDDSYSTRMKRVHAWRDASVKATCTFAGASVGPLSPSPSDAPSDTRPPSLKRKSNPHHADDDTVRLLYCVSLRPLISPPGLTYIKTLTFAGWP